MTLENDKVQTQIDLETVFSKYQKLDVLRFEFEEVVKDHEPESDQPFMIEVLAQLCLHRQASPEVMVGILTPRFGEPQDVADALIAMAELDLIDYNPERKVFSIIFDITDDVKDALERYQYPMPMITPPLPVESNNETGYHTISHSLVLNGKGWFDDEVDICLDHINRMNAVELTLDIPTINSAQADYQKPKRKPGEDFSEYRKRLQQAEQFYGMTVDVMAGLSNLTDSIYMTYRYDRRGRTYSSGYHINPQGTDYHKAVLQLATKELVK